MARFEGIGFPLGHAVFMPGELLWQHLDLGGLDFLDQQFVRMRLYK